MPPLEKWQENYLRKLDSFSNATLWLLFLADGSPVPPEGRPHAYSNDIWRANAIQQKLEERLLRTGFCTAADLNRGCNA